MNFKALFLSAEGRINRQPYWIGTIILTLINLPLSLLGRMSQEPTLLIVSLIVSLVLLYPGICVGIKRCHDRGRSGWFLLIALIPIVGAIWLLVELGFLRGTVGPNRFGPDPIDPSNVLARA